MGLNLNTSAPGKHLKSQEASVTDKLPTHNSQISTPGVGDVSSKNGNNEGQRRELTRDFYSKQRILGLPDNQPVLSPTEQFGSRL